MQEGVFYFKFNQTFLVSVDQAAVPHHDAELLEHLHIYLAQSQGQQHIFDLIDSYRGLDNPIRSNFAFESIAPRPTGTPEGLKTTSSNFSLPFLVCQCFREFCVFLCRLRLRDAGLNKKVSVFTARGQPRRAFIDLFFFFFSVKNEPIYK